MKWETILNPMPAIGMLTKDRWNISNEIFEGRKDTIYEKTGPISIGLLLDFLLISVIYISCDAELSSEL